MGNTWYEIEGRGEKEGGSNKIIKSYGDVAKSGAGSGRNHGAEVVGKTSKSDEEIEGYISYWIDDNRTYNVFKENCQKFAMDFIR